MTGRTQGCCTGVVHAGRFESHIIAVAGVALGSRWNMGARLADCRASIVTGGTGPDSAGRMSIGSPGPDRRRFVAGITLRRSYNVCHRFGLGVGKGKVATVTGRAV